MAMADSSTLPAPRGLALDRVYGLRLFYIPMFRRRIALALALAGVAGHVYWAVAQWSGLKSETVEWDYGQFHRAAVDLAAGRDPYAYFLQLCPGNHWCQGGYIFPPLLAELMRPFTQFSVVDGARVWLLLSYALVAATAFVAWRTVRPFIGTTGCLLLLAAGLLFTPLLRSYTLFQLGPAMLLVLAAAAHAHAHGDRRGRSLAGVLVSVATVLKVTPLLLAPALLELDRRGRRLLFAGMAAAAATGLVLVGVLELATPSTLEYFRDVLPRIGGSTPSLYNVSLPAVISRLSYLGVMPEIPGLLVGLIATAVLMIPTWLVWQRALAGGGDASVRMAGFAAVLSVPPIVSSITWDHHMVTEILVIVLLAPLLVRRRSGLWLVLAGYALMWIGRPVTDRLAAALGLADPLGWQIAPFLVITGANLVGMFCLWSACLVALASADHPLDPEQGIEHAPGVT